MADIFTTIIKILEPHKTDIDTFSLVTVLVRVALAVFAGGFIGNERGKHGSAAGLRTHILVCIGSCIASLTGIYVRLSMPDIMPGDAFRIAAQVVSGIGFLGAGMIIIKNTNTITGLTTAAGMWTTATIGIAIGFGFYSGAILATFACVFTAAFLTRFERKRKMSVNLYAEISNPKLAGKIFDDIHTKVSDDVLIEVVNSKSGINGNLALFITFSDSQDFKELREKIEAMEGIAFVIPE